jgi:hypothetical protein
MNDIHTSTLESAVSGKNSRVQMKIIVEKEFSANISEVQFKDILIFRKIRE